MTSGRLSFRDLQMDFCCRRGNPLMSFWSAVKRWLPGLSNVNCAFCGCCSKGESALSDEVWAARTAARNHLCTILKSQASFHWIKLYSSHQFHWGCIETANTSVDNFKWEKQKTRQINERFYEECFEFNVNSEHSQTLGHEVGCVQWMHKRKEKYAVEDTCLKGKGRDWNQYVML